MSMVHPFAGVADDTGVLGDNHALSCTTTMSAFKTSTSTPNPYRKRISRVQTATLGATLLLMTMLAAPLVSTQFAADASPALFGDTVPDRGDSPVAQDAGTSGDVIANFAMQYLGYPYVWAGNTPGGFDCSGFTQFVLINTLGIDIGHGVAGQTGYGSWVGWGEWQPGDLVYFAGTYRAGISHTGVYIGDGQFIHAENSGTGVVVSSLYSDYYGGHYYGAFRHG